MTRMRMKVWFALFTVTVLFGGIPTAHAQVTHSADTNGDFEINLSELLRVVQLFNSGEFHCQPGTEDGYAPGPGDRTCDFHDSDFRDHNWRIDLSELLRLIQLYNADYYEVDGSGESEDGFIPVFLNPPEGEGSSEGSLEGTAEGNVEGTPEGEGEGQVVRSAQVSISNAQGGPGETIFVQLNLLTENTLVGTLSFTLNYNSFRLQFNGAAAGTIVGAAGKQLSASVTGPNALQITVTDPPPVGGGMSPGILAILAFTISSEAEYGEEYVLFGTNASATTEQGNPLSMAVGNGQVRVSSATPIPPDARFSASPVRGLPGMEVVFRDQSVRGTGTNMSWFWEFGDGSTSTEQNPRHIYEEVGNYTVRLTVTTTHGSDTEEKPSYIDVFQGVVVYVDKDNTAGPHTGTSWSTAFLTIQEGITAASQAGGGEVWVAEGVYNEARNADSSGALVLSPTVNVYGGFVGVETQRDQRDFVIRQTIIEGATARNGSPAYHVVKGADNSRLDGFTIRGGRAVAGGVGTTDQQGAGLLCGLLNMTVANCVFTNNEAALSGAAIYHGDGSLRLKNCRFENNIVSNNGGNADSFAWGGAIYLTNGLLFAEDCTFTDNRTSSNNAWTGTTSIFSQAVGGAIYAFNSQCSIARSTFTNNRCSATGAGSGVIGSTVYAAVPEGLGGAIFGNYSVFTVDRCIFRSNAVETNNNGAFGRAVGGGMCLLTSQLTVTNSVFFGNTTRDFTNGVSGAAMYVDNSQQSKPAVITNCTVVTNTSSSINGSQSGGLYGVNLSPVITNCIFWNNSGLSISGSSLVATVTYSTIQGGFAGTGNLTSFPDFVNITSGDLRLNVTSPCIDAGRNTSSAEFGSVTVDLMGTARGFDGNPSRNVDGSDYDMGAYEFTP